MRIAYFIQAHHEPEVFRRLLHAVHNQSDLFLLHIDAKTKTSSYRRMLDGLERHKNVWLMPRMSVTWGGWSQCVAQLTAIRLLTEIREDWQYLINLSGQDFPIKPADYIRGALAAANGRNFVDIQRIDEAPERFRRIVKRRRSWLSFEIRGRVRSVPFWLGWATASRYRYAGSSWFMLSRDFCDWIATEGERSVRFLRFTRNPDEALVQHLIMESPMRDMMIPDNKRYYEWSGQPNPKVLTLDDFERLRNSNALFARKFASPQSIGLMDRIESTLLANPRTHLVMRQTP